MKKKATKRRDIHTAPVVCGLYSKKDVVRFLENGTHHVHSSSLGERNACARVTHEKLSGDRHVLYPWEPKNDVKMLWLNSSSRRREKVQEIISDLGIYSRRSLSGTIETVTEELLTNAIYHGYLAEDKISSKYPRMEQVNLEESEVVQVTYASDDNGVFLSVKDTGGSFCFDHLVKAFERCYNKDDGDQIHTSESGAGLGLYVIFEAVSHLKIEVEKDIATVFSCWIPRTGRFDPDTFSLNFFEWKEGGC